MEVEEEPLLRWPKEKFNIPLDFGFFPPRFFGRLTSNKLAFQEFFRWWNIGTQQAKLSLELKEARKKINFQYNFALALNP